MTFAWKPFSDKQLDLIENSTAKINIADGPVRSGKTISCLVRWIEYVKTAPQGGDLMMIGKTRDALYRNAVSILEEMLGPKRCRYNRGTGELHMLGKTVYCVGAADARSEEKIRGSTLSGAYINEITVIPELTFKQIVARCSVEGSKVFGDTNPDSPYHWLHKDWLASEKLIREGAVRRWRFVMDDNLALSQETKNYFLAIYTGLWAKRMIQGLWVQAEGAIYDMWDDEKHLYDELPGPAERWWVGIDYGTGNPTAFILAAEIEGVLYAEREYYWDSHAEGRQKTDAEYSRDLKEFLKGIAVSGIFADPSAASFITQVRQDRVGNVIPADNAVVDGIRNVSTYLSNLQLKVNRCGCAGLVADIQSYVWDAKAQKRGIDQPLKTGGVDHRPDALRYLVQGISGATVGEIPAATTTTIEQLAGTPPTLPPALQRSVLPPGLRPRPS